MKLGTLLFGVAAILALAPASALATSTPSSPRPTCMLRASQGAVELGRTTNLSWTSQYATQGFITSIGTVGTAGTQGVIPTGRGTTYVGTFTGPGGTGTCSITVNTIQPSGGGTIEDPGKVEPPDRLPPSQGGGSPTTLPPANEITLSNTKSTGLIPCSGLDCEACHLASLAQKVINFLIGLSIPLAAAMFAYAGFIYFTSSVVDKLAKANKIFKSIGIGFMIVLGAWLGVQTVLKTILDPSYYKNWNTIQCVGKAARPMDKNIGQLLSSLPGLNTNALVPASSPTQTYNYDGTTDRVVTCQDGSTWSQGALNCVDGDGEITAPKYAATPNNGVGTAQMASLIADACSRLGVTSFECTAVSGRFAGAESGGGRNCTTSTTGAVGCMQVLPSTACTIDSSIDGCDTCSRRNGGSLGAGCATVAQAIADPALNTRLGVQYIAQQYNTFGSCQAAASAYYQGPGLTQSHLRNTGSIPPAAVGYANKVCN